MENTNTTGNMALLVAALGLLAILSWVVFAIT
jgi:hypothetical protein